MTNFLLDIDYVNTIIMYFKIFNKNKTLIIYFKTFFTFSVKCLKYFYLSIEEQWVNQVELGKLQA